MAKQFQFDDEMTDEKVEISNEESTDMSEESLKDEPFSTHSFNFEDEVIEDKTTLILLLKTLKMMENLKIWQKPKRKNNLYGYGGIMCYLDYLH